MKPSQMVCVDHSRHYFHCLVLSLAQEADASSQATDTARAKDVVARCGALASERPRASFTTKNLEQDLARLLRSGNVEQHRDVLERSLAASALSGETHARFMASGPPNWPGEAGTGKSACEHGNDAPMVPAALI